MTLILVMAGAQITRIWACPNVVARLHPFIIADVLIDPFTHALFTLGAGKRGGMSQKRSDKQCGKDIEGAIGVHGTLLEFEGQSRSPFVDAGTSEVNASGWRGTTTL